MIEFLLARALAKLPEHLRARYEAEWRGDLAALNARRFAALRWAIGLPRASAELRAQHGHERRARVPRLVFDAMALGLAYYVAYRVRFGADVPAAYHDLLVQTLPFAVVGGLVCMALTGNYAATGGGALRVAKGVTLATLALIAYAALVQPTLVHSVRGLMVLNVPAGVCALFTVASTCAMLLERALLDLARAHRRA